MQGFRFVVFAALAVGLGACATSPSARVQSATSLATPLPASAFDSTPLRDAARRLAVRATFGTCLQAASNAAPAAQACVESELRFQESRLQEAVATRRGQAASNGDTDAVQAQWLSERDRICGPDHAGIPTAQRIGAQLCRLEATVARAEVLAR